MSSHLSHVSKQTLEHFDFKHKANLKVSTRGEELDTHSRKKTGAMYANIRENCLQSTNKNRFDVR